MGDSGIRPAQMEDLDAFAGDSHRTGMFQDRLRRQAKGLGELWVAEFDSELVGNIYLWLEDAEEFAVREKLPGIPLLMNFWVRPDRRRKGIGTQLMEGAEQRLLELGYIQVALGVDGKNTIAIRLYDGRGYERWPYEEDVPTIRREFWPDGAAIEHPEVCVMYVKDLGSREGCL